MLNACCDTEVKEKNCPVDQNTMCSQAKWIFEKLSEESGETVKDENFEASNDWFSRFKNLLQLAQHCGEWRDSKCQ